jgi:predicted metal-binding protein
MEGEKADFNDLIELARWLGASDAAIISAQDISVEDDLAKLCLDLPCENYGLSGSCPPHVAGPSGI